MIHYFEEATIYHEQIPRVDVTLHIIKILLAQVFGAGTKEQSADNIAQQMEQTSFPSAKAKISNAEVLAWEKAGYPALNSWLTKHRKKK